MEVLILGAGTAGTMAAAGLRKRLPAGNRVTVVDTDDTHVYQPGLLLLPFGVYEERQIVRSRRAVLPKGVDMVTGQIEVVDPGEHEVTLSGGTVLRYDQLVIATGTSPRPDQTPGMTDTPGVHEFYTLAGSLALREALAAFSGGKLVVGITEMPIKCPVAPLEFAFLADAHLRKRGIRDRVEITYVTPLDGAFTKAVCSRELGHLLTERNITLETDFMLEHVEAGRLVSYDERVIEFDLLATVPINMGADYLAKSGLGDELNYVPTDKHTLRAEGYDDIWVVGDAANLPTSKAGSVAHFSMEAFLTNFMDVQAGRSPSASFDGHSNCFIESGDGKALLIDFNYDVEPLPGTYPLPTVGLPLLRESRFNHLGKLGFRYLYWHALLPERKLPIPSAMSMRGKKQPAAL
jgi:sulfide:quinone oxidoreductase